MASQSLTKTIRSMLITFNVVRRLACAVALTRVIPNTEYACHTLLVWSGSILVQKMGFDSRAPWVPFCGGREAASSVHWSRRVHSLRVGTPVPLPKAPEVGSVWTERTYETIPRGTQGASE